MSRSEDFEHSFTHGRRTYQYGATVHDFAFHDPTTGDGAYASMVHTPDQHYSEYDRYDQQHFGPDTEPNGQGMLFKSAPGELEVESLYASRGGRHAVPTLLGAAADYAQRRYGRLPSASGNLSKHSAPLVQKFVDRGLIQNPQDSGPVQAFNTIEMNDVESHDAAENAKFMNRHHDPMPAQQVRIGQQFIRAALRKPKIEQPQPDRTTEMWPAEQFKKQQRLA